MITAVVCGSFKFKPEIGRTIEILEATGIEVLEPAKEWLIIVEYRLDTTYSEASLGRNDFLF